MKILHHWFLVTAFVLPFSVNAASKEAAPVEEKSNESHSTYGAENPLIPDFAFGPALTLLGLPTPLRFGLETKYLNTVGLSFDYGLIPTIPIDTVTVGLTSWNITAKYYLFQRAMYVGVGFGTQVFTGTSTDTNVNLTVTATVTTTFLSPHIGWRWVWPSGFFYGMEVGVQVPLTNSTSTTSNNPALNSTPEFVDLSNQIDTNARLLGRTPLPLVTLVQVGWFL